MQIRDILNKLNHLEEAPVNPYKDPAQKAKFDSLSDEDKEWLTNTVTDMDGKERPGMPDISDNGILARAPNKGKPKFEPDPTGLDGAAGDMPSKTPGPVQAAAEPTSDNNGGSKANNDAIGLAGAAGAAAAKAIADPESKTGQQVQKDLSTPAAPDPEVEKLVKALDDIDKFLKKYGIRVETIAESVYSYYRANINDFLTPQQQIKNWSMLSEDSGRQKLDEFLAGVANRFAARALARRMMARERRRLAAQATARAGRSSMAHHADLDMMHGAKRPWYKNPWVQGAAAVGGVIMAAPAIKDIMKMLGDMFKSKDEQQPMMPQTGPEDPNKPKDSNDPTKKDPNNPNAPTDPNNPTIGGIPTEEVRILWKNWGIVYAYSKDQAKFDALDEAVKIRITNTGEALSKFIETGPNKR
jgi:hypothetical protein